VGKEKQEQEKGYYGRSLGLGINLSVKEMICGRRRFRVEMGLVRASEEAISQYRFQSFHRVVDNTER
jgi:hypothetical protein